MTLGEKIAALRARAQLSQGDLAEKLNVSRQSVSKWETDASIPELDKLIQLSEMFAITIDQLVKCDSLPENNEPETPEPEPPKQPETEPLKQPEVKPQPSAKSGTQRIVGFILLGLGGLAVILGLTVGSLIGFSWIGVILGVYLALIGGICLLVKRYAALVIGWITLLFLALSSIFVMRPVQTTHHSISTTSFTGVLLLPVLLLLLAATAVTVILAVCKKK